MLAAAGWRGTPATGGALHDPCCGSGTIAIEAAQIACGIAPGAAAPLRLRAAAAVRERRDARRDAAPAQPRARSACAPRAVPIFASDVSFRMVDFARRNAERAGVADCDPVQRRRRAGAAGAGLPPDLPGHADAQPALRRADRGRRQGARSAGARLGRGPGDAERLLRPPRRALEAGLHPIPAGWTAWILSPDMRLPSAMRLKESRRVPLWNGPIECRLFRFDLVAGSARAARTRRRRLDGPRRAAPRAAARRTRAAPRRSAPAARASRG